MATLRLSAGHTVEVVSPQELEAILRGVLGEARAERNRGPQVERPADGIKLDNTGACVPTTIFTVPQGMDFALHRVIIDDDTHTPGNPFTAAGAYMDILRRGVREDFLALTAAAGGFPVVKTWSMVEAIRFRNGETVQVQFVAGPANGTVLVRMQGTLQPFTPS